MMMFVVMIVIMFMHVVDALDVAAAGHHEDMPVSPHYVPSTACRLPR